MVTTSKHTAMSNFPPSFFVKNEPPITQNNNDLKNYIYEVVTDFNLQGATGPVGPVGPPGAVGATGAVGASGPSGGVLSAADFNAQMPGDNAATVAVGAAVEFPNDGSIYGADISRLSASTFNLASVGLYQVSWQVSVDEPGQLIVKLNAAEISTSCAGRATGTNQIVGMCIVPVAAPNAVLSITNPVGNAAALTITPIAGGAHTVSAHLVIVRLS